MINMDESITLDCTVRSDVSKNSTVTVDSKTDSCRASNVVLIKKNVSVSKNEQIPKHVQQDNGEERKFEKKVAAVKRERVIMMLTSCGQLLLGLVLVVFGVLVLVHGVFLGSSGAGLWAGAGALIAGALGLVATLTETTSVFSTAHLASSLVALALSNMSTITALTVVVRDLRSTPDSVLLLPSEDAKWWWVEIDTEGLLANMGLLLSSFFELIVAGYTCITLTPKLCGCLNQQRVDYSPNNELDNDGKMKRRNMVHQWVIAQTHIPKTPPPPPPRALYIPFTLSLHPIIQTPYGNTHPAHYIPTYGPVPIIPHLMASPARPPMQMYRPRTTRCPSVDHEELSIMDQQRRHHHHHHHHHDTKTNETISIDENENACTYTGLDKKISEEFISICMDPERKSKASSHHQT